MNKAQLEKKCKELRVAFDKEREQHHLMLAKADRLEKELAHMTTEATAGQIGLVRYVHALERFAAWLKASPKVRRSEVIAWMSAFGPVCPCGCGDEFIAIWDVKLGYDPRKDYSRSIVNPKSYHWQRTR